MSLPRLELKVPSTFESECVNSSYWAAYVRSGRVVASACLRTRARWMEQEAEYIKEWPIKKAKKKKRKRKLSKVLGKVMWDRVN